MVMHIDNRGWEDRSVSRARVSRHPWIVVLITTCLVFLISLAFAMPAFAEEVIHSEQIDSDNKNEIYPADENTSNSLNASQQEIYEGNSNIPQENSPTANVIPQIDCKNDGKEEEVVQDKKPENSYCNTSVNDDSIADEVNTNTNPEMLAISENIDEVEMHEVEMHENIETSPQGAIRKAPVRNIDASNAAITAAEAPSDASTQFGTDYKTKPDHGFEFVIYAPRDGYPYDSKLVQYPKTYGELSNTDPYVFYLDSISNTYKYFARGSESFYVGSEDTYNKYLKSNNEFIFPTIAIPGYSFMGWAMEAMNLDDGTALGYPDMSGELTGGGATSVFVNNSLTWETASQIYLHFYAIWTIEEIPANLETAGSNLAIKTKNTVLDSESIYPADVSSYTSNALANYDSTTYDSSKFVWYYVPGAAKGVKNVFNSYNTGDKQVPLKASDAKANAKVFVPGTTRMYDVYRDAVFATDGSANWFQADGLYFYLTYNDITSDYTVEFKTSNASQGNVSVSGTSDNKISVAKSTGKLTSEQIGKITTSPKTGWEFDHWATEANGASICNLANYKFTADTTIYAVWKQKTGYKVTFDLGEDAVKDGATPATIPDQGTYYNTNIILTQPTWAGHTFSGWYLSSDMTKQAAAAGITDKTYQDLVKAINNGSDNDTIKTLALKAKWDTKTYIVNYDLNGGSGSNPSSQTVGYNDFIPVPSSTYTKPGYTFQGWYSAASGGDKITGNNKKYYGSEDNNSSITVYAQWKENIVTITYKVTDEGAKLRHGGNSSETAVTTITDYVGAATGDLYTSADASATKINPGQKNISGGIAPVYTTDGSGHPVYEYVGWYTKPDYTSAANNAGTALAFKPAKQSGVYTDATYYLHVQKKSFNYAVEYYLERLDGSGYDAVTHGTVSGDGWTTDLKAQYGTSVAVNDWNVAGDTKVAPATIEGYSYSAEVTASNSNGRGRIDSIAYVDSTNRNAWSANVLKLYYTRNAYAHTMTYAETDKPDGVALPAATPANGTASDATWKYGDTINIAAPSAQTGYTWKGWTAEKGDGTTLTVTNNTDGTASFTMPADTVALTGTWEAIKYYVVYKNDTVSGRDTWGTVEYNDGTSKHNINSAGYTIQWKYGQALPAVTATTSDADQYYFLGFQYLDASGSDKKHIQDPTSLTLNTDNFKFTDSTGGASTTGNYVVLTARWDKVVVVEYMPTANGNFEKVSEGSLKANDEDLIKSFTDMGGASDDDTSNERNAGKPKAKPGYTFTGWNTAENGLGEILYASKEEATAHSGRLYVGMVLDKSYTFYAQYEPTTQKLTVLDANGNTHAAVIKKTGESYTLPTDVTKAGYTLAGWKYTDENGDTKTINVKPYTYTPVGPGVTVNNIDWGYTFTPTFTENTVEIKYQFANGSSGMGTIAKATDTTKDAGDSIKAETGTAAGATATGKAGQYRFVGWYTDPAASTKVSNALLSSDGKTITPQKNSDGIYEAATYYAKFVPVTYDVTVYIDTTNDNHGTLSYGTTTGATAYGPQSYNYGTKLSDIVSGAGITVVPTSDAFEQTGWKVKSGESDWVSVSLTGLADKILEADTSIVPVFGETHFTVTYDANGGSPALSDSDKRTVTWYQTVGPNADLTKTGYDFAGWQVKLPSGGYATLTNTAYAPKFEDVANTYKNGGASAYPSKSTPVTLRATWTAKNWFTVNYEATRNASGGTGTEGVDYPTGVVNPDPKTPVSWDQAGLVPVLADHDGWTLWGWYLSTTPADQISRNSVITSLTKYSELAGGNDAQNSYITLYALWERNTYTVKYMDEDGTTLNTSNPLYWDSVIPEWTPSAADASRSFSHWYYNSGDEVKFGEGGTKVSDVAGTGHDSVSSVNVYASWQKSQAYTVDYYLIAYDAATGAYTVSTTPVAAAHKTGYVKPGTAVNADSVAKVAADGTTSTVNYWDEYTLLGFVAAKNNEHGATNVASFTSLENSGSNTALAFKLYLYEKTYTVTYDTGVNGVAAPNSRTVGWDDAPITPATAPIRAGYNAPTWKYGDTTIGNGTTVQSLLGTNDTAGTDGKTIALAADWTIAKVKITYTAQYPSGSTGGSVTANNAAADANIDAVGATPAGATATVTDPNYKLEGWYYNNGTTDIQVMGNGDNADSLTLVLPTGTDAAPLVNREYFARFVKRSNINYTIEHYYMNTDGTYGPAASKTDNGSDLEGATVKAADHKAEKSGFSYAEGTEGSIPEITLQATDTTNRTLRLYYARDKYHVVVVPVAAGADRPDTIPAIDSSTYDGGVYYEATANLPTVQVPDGWTLTWKLDAADLADGATTFGVPLESKGADGSAGKVTLTAVWTRIPYDVIFSAPDNEKPAGENPALFSLNGTTNTTVSYGKTLKDELKSVPTANNPSNYKLVGWKVLGSDGATVLSDQIDDPAAWTITQKTYFVPQWKKIITITWYKGDHAAAGTDDKHEFGPFTDTTTVLPLWNGTDGDLGHNYASDTNDHPTADTGYEFIGWTWKTTDTTGGEKTHAFYLAGKTPANTSGIVVETALPAHTDANYSFTAAYAGLKRTLSFSAGDGTWQDGTTAAKTVVAATGETVTTGIPTASNINYAGHELKGWKLVGDTTDTLYTSATGIKVPQTAAETLEFTPEWKTTTVTISYEVQKDAKGVARGTLSEGSVDVDATAASATGSKATANKGYEYDGWYLKGAGGSLTAVDPTWVVMGTTTRDGVSVPTYTLTPQKSGNLWTAATYVVKFKPGTTDYTVEYWMQTVDKTDYEQDDSLTKTVSGAPTEGTAKVADNLLADGQAKGFEHPEDNAGFRTEETIIGTGQTILKVYYNRRSFDVSYTITGTDGKRPDASYDPNVTNGGQVYGDTVTLPTPSAPGFTFAWSAKDADGNDVTISSNTFTVPASAVAVTGTWAPVQYKVQYNANAGSDAVADMPTNNDNVVWNVSFTPDKTPSRAGWRFMSWNTAADGSGISLDPGTTTYETLAGSNPNLSPLTLFAQWEQNKYRVIYVDGDTATGSASLPATRTDATWESTDLLPAGGATPTKDGYTFIGWQYGKDGTMADYANQPLYEVAQAEGLTAADFVGATGDAAEKGIKFYAAWKKNATFQVIVKKDGSNEAVPTDWPASTFTGVDGQVVTVAVAADGTVTILGTKVGVNDGQYMTADAGHELPTLAGWEYSTDAAAKSSLTPYPLDADEALHVFTLYLTPKTGYAVEYYDQDGTKVFTRDNVNWNTDNLDKQDATNAAAIAAPTGHEGEKFLGWYTAKTAGPKLESALTYEDLVLAQAGSYDDKYKTVKLYAQWAPRLYAVEWVDATDVADASGEVVIKHDATLGWKSLVSVDEPEDLADYVKDGYVFKGWELRAAAGADPTPVTDNMYKSLAGALPGYDDTMDAESGTVLKIYAKWAKYVGYTVEYYTTEDGTTLTKIKGADKTHTPEEHLALEGESYTSTQADDFTSDQRPAGYKFDADASTLMVGTPVRDAASNVVKVVFNKIRDYKVILDANKGTDDAQTEVTGLTWDDKSAYDKATAEPTRMGHTLHAKPTRWNTKADGTGAWLSADLTYGELAKLIDASADDLALETTGITLYAQYDVNSDYAVDYSLNYDDKGVDQTLVPTDAAAKQAAYLTDKRREDVSWPDSDFVPADTSEIEAPRGYELAGWFYTAADGTRVDIDANTTYEAIATATGAEAAGEKSVRLYAKWVEQLVAIAYETADAATGIVTRAVDYITAVTGKPATSLGTSSAGTAFTSVAQAKPGYHFVKWSLKDASSDATLTAAAAVGGLNTTTDEALASLQISKGTDGLYHAATYVASFEANPDATLAYDLNGGTGQIADVVKPNGSLLTLSDGTGATRDYYELTGWNTKADGTGTAYKLGETDVVLPEDGLTLFAQWTLKRYTATIPASTGEGGSVSGTTAVVTYGENLPEGTGAAANPVPATGKRLAGWTYTMVDDVTGEVTTGTVSDPSDLKILGDVTFEPVWEDDPNYVAPSAVTTTKSATGTAGAREGIPQTGDPFVAAPLALTASGLFFLLLAALVSRRARTLADDRLHNHGSDGMGDAS